MAYDETGKDERQVVDIGLNVKNFIGLGSQAEYGPCQNKIDEFCFFHIPPKNH